MNRWLGLTLGMFIVLNCVLAFLLLRSTEPFPPELEADLAEIQAQMDAAKQDTEDYGGLIGAQAQLRMQVLQSTYAMLDQKRRALLRGVRLDYRVEGKHYNSASDTLLESLGEQLAEQERVVAQAELKAEAFGGLVGALARSTAMAEHLTLAGLRQRHIAAKYGIPALAKLEEEMPSTPLGEITNDEEAL